MNRSARRTSLALLVPVLAATLAVGAPRDGSTAGSAEPAVADTVVDGFHGYEFGTPGARIAEIDVSGPPEYRVAGLDVFARTVRFLGMPTRTYFYVDSDAERLRRGKHLIEAESDACVRQLASLRLMVSGTHPDLRVEVVRRSGTTADTSAAGRGGRPTIRCPEFLRTAPQEGWTVLFRNPDSGLVEARMELFARDGSPRILACYLNDDDCAWPDSVSVRPGPKLRAPGRTPDTSGVGRGRASRPR